MLEHREGVRNALAEVAEHSFFAATDPVDQAQLLELTAAAPAWLQADTIGEESDLEVVATAADPFIARDLILQCQPSLVTLDIDMPRMDGLRFLRRLMEHHPLPVSIVSSLTKSGSQASIEALASG